MHKRIMIIKNKHSLKKQNDHKPVHNIRMIMSKWIIDTQTSAYTKTKPQA